MNAHGRVLYLAPDVDRPSGGVGAIYSHVETLRHHGYDAFVVHFDAAKRYAWADEHIPVLAFSNGLRFYPDDVLVVPEGLLLPELAQMRRIKKIAFVQSCLFAYSHPAGHNAWRDTDFQGALCCSELTERFTRHTLGIANVWRVPNVVDPEIFFPREKKLQIAFMPRKNPEEVKFLRSSFLLRNQEPVPWVQLDAMTPAQVGAALGQSAVFLSTCYYEGFNLPPLEAMSCAALVVGFHGYGGLEYATPDNGLWCAQGDLQDCLDKLEQAVALFSRADPRLTPLQQNGLVTAERYRKPARDQALLSAWANIMGDYSRRWATTRRRSRALRSVKSKITS